MSSYSGHGRQQPLQIRRWKTKGDNRLAVAIQIWIPNDGGGRKPLLANFLANGGSTSLNLTFGDIVKEIGCNVRSRAVRCGIKADAPSVACRCLQRLLHGISIERRQRNKGVVHFLPFAGNTAERNQPAHAGEMFIWGLEVEGGMEASPAGQPLRA